VIGATTDEGMLPDPFINRFPLRPVLEPYTKDDLTRIAKMNAEILDVGLTWEAARLFAGASRGVPRQINNYVRNGAMLGTAIDEDLAREVLHDLNRVTIDGLTLDMQNVLRFLTSAPSAPTAGRDDLPGVGHDARDGDRQVARRQGGPAPHRAVPDRAGLPTGRPRRPEPDTRRAAPRAGTRPRRLVTAVSGPCNARRRLSVCFTL
jgi:hypothetical protein